MGVGWYGMSRCWSWRHRSQWPPACGPGAGTARPNHMRASQPQAPLLTSMKACFSLMLSESISEESGLARSSYTQRPWESRTTRALRPAEVRPGGRDDRRAAEQCAVKREWEYGILILRSWQESRHWAGRHWAGTVRACALRARAQVCRQASQGLWAALQCFQLHAPCTGHQPTPLACLHIGLHTRATTHSPCAPSSHVTASTPAKCITHLSFLFSASTKCTAHLSPSTPPNAQLTCHLRHLAGPPQLVNNLVQKVGGQVQLSNALQQR